MKKIFTLVAATALTLGANAQSIVISSAEPNLAADWASGCEIDWNNDGILEGVIGGGNAVGQMIEDENGDEVFMEHNALWKLTWDGSKYAYEQFSPNAVQWDRRHVIPADFNGDGNVDLYFAGGGDAHTLNGLFLNDGKGNFVSDDRFKVLDEEGNEIADEETGALRWLPRACDVADFNNDGLLDIVTCGWWLSPATETAMNGVLMNNGDGTYTVTNRYAMGNEGDETAIAFALCTIKAFDLNNDGYCDILVQGNVDNKDEVGTNYGRTFMVLLNDAEEPGTFISMEAETWSHSFGNGNFNVADFNNDGTPDLFVTGESPDDAVSGWNYYGQLFFGKLTKGDLTYTEANNFAAAGKDIRPLCSTNIGTRAIDYTNDGYYDLFLDGWSTEMLDGTDNTQVGWLFKGSDAGLAEYQRIPGASEQGILFLDYGVTGSRNYCFTGYHGDGNYFGDDQAAPSGRSMVFTKNPWGVAERPAAPANVKADVDGNTVTLSWDAPAGEKKNVTYEYYLKLDGKIYNGCTSFIGGENDGIRKVVREGNAYMNKTLTLTLADGTYEWGVQTVNAALRGSVFANGGSIVVGTGDGIANVEASKKDNAVYNIAGQRVNNSFRGIAIENGKKVIK